MSTKPPADPPVIRALRKACANGQNAWAAQHGIDKGHLSRILAGQRPMSDANRRTET